MQGLWSCKDVDMLFTKYAEKGGMYCQVEGGGLGYGTLVFWGAGLKSCVVREIVLNEWSSAHKVKFYRHLPKKYEQMLKKVYY